MKYLISIKALISLSIMVFLGTVSAFGQYYISGTTSVNSGSSYTYNLNPSSSVQYTNWSAVNGTVSGTSMTSRSVNWNTPGSGSVSVSGVDFLYNSISATLNVTITGTIPSTPPAPTVQSSSCGQVVLARATPPSGITYYWQSTSTGTSTSSSASTVTRTSGTIYYLRARNSSGSWSTNSSSVTYTIPAAPTWYADVDGDGFGDPNSAISQCTQPAGYVSNSGDGCPNDYDITDGCPPVSSGGENYVHSISYQKPFLEGSQSNAFEDEKIETKTYIDGLGEPMQQNMIRGSNNGDDIITYIEKDIYGRQAIDYLPVNLGSTGGDFTAINPSSDINNYYYDKYPSEWGNASSANPFSKKDFEKSPLNRVLKQAAPGESWKSGNGHEIEFGYATNTSTEVRYYYVTTTYANNTYTPTLKGGTSYYAVNTLYKNITYDENHTSGTAHSTEEFKDKQGRVILKRTYGSVDLNGDGDTIDSGEANAAYDTYYVYDDFGNLTYVLPPKSEPHGGIPNATELAELCYQYKYDNRNRLVEKKIPGKGWEYIVYNKLDQPIMTQDDNLKTKNKWLFTKYDAFGRVAFTGITNVSAGTSRTTLQDSANGTTNQWVTSRTSSTTLGGVPIYYNNNSTYPTTVSEVLNINYYDNYVDISGGANPGTVYGTPTTTNVKGLPTVSKVKVLGSSNWITGVTYYDDKGRAIYVYGKNDFLGTTDIIENKLDFTGKKEQSTTTHTKNSVSLVTIDRFEYDHMGRLIAQIQKIGNQNSRRILHNNYDDLGQLTSKLIDNGTAGGFKDVTGLSLSNDVITKTTSNNWGNAGLATNGYFAQDGYIEYEAMENNTRAMLGLSTSNTNAHYNTIHFAIYNSPSGTVMVYESGSSKGTFGTYVAGDVFRVERVGNTIYYKKNGEIFYTSTKTSTGSLYGDASFYTGGKRIKDLVIVDNSKGIQTVDYAYNIRGWLKNINMDINNDNDLFDFTINYNTMSHSGTKLYNGNISETEWKTQNDNVLRWYRYGYDALNRIVNATANSSNYNLTNVTYDKNGNIAKLKRQGHRNATFTSFGVMDDLTYTYQPTSNKLVKVADAASIDQFGFKDDAVNTASDTADDYTYDTNGNMISDANKGITNISYNHLNLPTVVTINGQNISYFYDATGVKLRKTVNGINTDYAGNYIYESNQLQFLNTPEGYAEPIDVTNYNAGFRYTYQYKDHLGNIRLSYTDKNQNIGAIDLEIIEENNYYPFGLKHNGYNGGTNGQRHHKYMFGGKELQDEIVGSSSFEVYDFGARNYDPALGRWMNLDPLAEQMRRHSPYNYAFNNPIYFIDPDGMAPTSPEHIYRLNEKGKIELVAIDNTKDVVFSADGKRSIEFDSGTIMAGFSLENPNPDYAQDLGSPIEGVYMNDENSATELFEFAAAETGDPIKGAEWAISTGDLKGESLSMVGTNYNNTKVDTGLLTESLVENGFNVTKADHSHQDDSPPSGFDNNKALLINGERIKDAAAAGAIEKTTKGEAITRVFNVKSKTYTYYTKNLIYGTN